MVYLLLGLVVWFDLWLVDLFIWLYGLVDLLLVLCDLVYCVLVLCGLLLVVDLFVGCFAGLVC